MDKTEDTEWFYNAIGTGQVAVDPDCKYEIMDRIFDTAYDGEYWLAIPILKVMAVAVGYQRAILDDAKRYGPDEDVPQRERVLREMIRIHETIKKLCDGNPKQ